MKGMNERTGRKIPYSKLILPRLLLLFSIILVGFANEKSMEEKTTKTHYLAKNFESCVIQMEQIKSRARPLLAYLLFGRFYISQSQSVSTCALYNELFRQKRTDTWELFDAGAIFISREWFYKLAY